MPVLTTGFASLSGRQVVPRYQPVPVSVATAVLVPRYHTVGWVPVPVRATGTPWSSRRRSTSTSSPSRSLCDARPLPMSEPPSRSLNVECRERGGPARGTTRTNRQGIRIAAHETSCPVRTARILKESRKPDALWANRWASGATRLAVSVQPAVLLTTGALGRSRVALERRPLASVVVSTKISATRNSWK